MNNARRSSLFLLVMVIGFAPAAALAADTPAEPAGAHETAATASGAEAGAQEAGAHGETHEQPSLLTPDLGSAVWTIVLFVALLFVLSKYIWPPILKGLQDREEKIRADLEHAEAAARQAEETLREYQARLAAAAQEAQQVIEKSRDDARRLAEQLREQTEHEIKLIRQHAENEMTAAKERAIGELYAEAGLIATHIAGRILQRELSPDDQKQLIDETLNEFSRTNEG